MCARSQFEISDIAKLIHSGKPGRKIMAVLKFQCDESYDPDWMVVGGWIAEQSEWENLENDWDNCIDQQNSIHNGNQQITKFHATDLNGYREEFKNWDKGMSEAFTVPW